MAKKANNQVVVKVKSDGGEIQKGLHLYLFDNEDRLIEKAALKNGEAKLKTVSTKIKGRSQVIIGPEIPKEFKGRSINPILIKKMGGYQPSIKLDRNNQIEIIGLPKFKSPLWDWCLITGNLSKSFTIDGENTVLPVCDTRVHICEIDRIKWWWPRIPRPIITDLGLKLKEIIIKPKIKFPPIPDPKTPINPRIPIKKITNPIINREFFAPSAEDPLALAELPDNVKRGLLSKSETIVHQTIFDNFKLLHPYICWWPWFWPYFYRCTKIGTVYSDCNGNFDYNYLNFTNEKDIYIWVEANIDGEWTTVYRPNIPCSTYWNYKCGKEINIRITDPRVRPCECDPLPGAIVWMKRVNTGSRIRNIQQNGAPSAHLTNAIGLTYYGATGDKVSPFGGKFPFILQFGSGFPNSTVTHYRWSYRKISDAFLTGVMDTEHDLRGEIRKPYTYEVSTGTDTVFETGTFLLGPTYNTIAGKSMPKYKIPHVEASDDVVEPTAEWNQDTRSINIDSPDFDNGLYQFTFELLNSSGNVVPVSANTFVVDRLSTDITGPTTINADGLSENYVVKNGTGKALAFKFRLRIDNQECYADVLDALVDGSSTDTECGVGYYDDKVNDKATLNFLAGHPQDYAHYGFGITKGNSNNVPVANSSGYVTQSNNLYAISTILNAGVQKDLYQKEVNVSKMLGSCKMAAFAEVLRVYATHTNGANRLNEYDASDVAAIVLAEKPLEEE